MDIMKKSFLTNTFFISLVITTQSVYSQNLADLCKEAILDIKTIQLSLNSLLDNTTSDDFINKIKPIHDKWIQKIASDPCASGGCDLKSDALKMSVITTNISGLTSKIMTQDKNQLIEEISKESTDKFIEKPYDSLRKICKSK